MKRSTQLLGLVSVLSLSATAAFAQHHGGGHRPSGPTPNRGGSNHRPTSTPSQQPTHRAPAPTYRTPQQHNPAPTYRTPQQHNPAPTYRAPQQHNPAPTYRAPQQHTPAPTYRTPTQHTPAPTYRGPAPTQRTPSPTYRGPAPQQRTPTANGGYTVNRGNRTTTYRQDGTRAQVVRGNTRVDYHNGGGQTVYRGGNRHYTQVPVRTTNGYSMQRTYYRGNTTVVHNYHNYRWGGHSYYRYHPAYTYDRWYYGYIYTPWYTPVNYTWGWYSSPWYGHYGYYYRPYPRYTSPAYWLTDFLIAGMLADQYNDSVANSNTREAEAYAERAATPISDEVKEQIKIQVEEAVRAHEQQHPAQIDTVLRDTRHIYAVSDDLDVTTGETGEACSLTNGDLIRLTAVPTENDQAAAMTVVSAKKGSCAAGSQIMVSITDLQSFENDFTERLEDGMEKMKTEFPKQ